MNATLNNIDFEPLTEVKAKLSEKISLIEQKRRLLAITVNGKPKVMMVPYEEFLAMCGGGLSTYVPRKISLEEWKKQSVHRRAVSKSITDLFDMKSLSRKGQKPYKRDAVKKFK
ncbi:MAG: type II toxin-antitoxin system Phd/YefM family antitoxin [Deltaproteobacteria bacterium]|nr:type II toxin-antitoxin system Phd/YefM family antitoxin [Deltaproteobacteria bacterium]